MIDAYRVQMPPVDLDRIVIGVDPAITKTSQADHTGIIIAGKKSTQNNISYYILDDCSLIGTPGEWATQVVRAFDRWQADRVVAEVNQGGDMVEATLRSLNANLPIKTVRATRGKIVRAEPVAALYEQGRVHHVGEFVELEEEMTSYTGEPGEASPDRMDALVWALTELMEETEVNIGQFSFF